MKFLICLFLLLNLFLTAPVQSPVRKFKPGDTEWRETGTKYSLKNVGSAPFEIVDIELK